MIHKVIFSFYCLKLKNKPQLKISNKIKTKLFFRSQAILKWAPSIYEKDKMILKQKEKEFRENENKDLEKEYHFNRYLQKKYLIRHHGDENKKNNIFFIIKKLLNIIISTTYGS